MGVTFSALDLDIRSTGSTEALDVLDKIDRRVEQIQRKIDAMVSSLGAKQAAAQTQVAATAAAAEQAATKAAAAIDEVAPAAKRAAAATEEIAVASEHAFSHSALIGVGELARGIGRVVQSGQTGAFAMREFSGAAVRLGGALGPGAGLAGVAILLAGSFYEAFTSIRKQMQATEDQFRESIARMANAGKSQEIQQQMRLVLYGQPYDENNKLVAPSKLVSGAFENSLSDLEARFAAISQKIPGGATMAPGPIAEEYNKLAKAIDAAAQKYNALNEAALNIANQPATMAGALPAMRVTAESLEALTQKAEKDAVAAEKYLAKVDLGRRLDEQTLTAMGVQRTAGLVGPGISPDELLRGDKNGIKIAKLIPTPTQRDAAEVAKQWREFADALGTRVATTIGTALTKGLEAVFARGGGIGAGFKAMAASLLEGLGDMLEQIGEKALAGLQLMATVKHAIEGFLPEVGIPGAIALIALGAALKAAGARSASAGSGGGGGYGPSAPSAITSTYYVPPASHAAGPSASSITPLSTFAPHVTIIGKDDPTVQRQFMELAARATRRGSTRG